MEGGGEEAVAVQMARARVRLQHKAITSPHPHGMDGQCQTAKHRPTHTNAQLPKPSVLLLCCRDHNRWHTHTMGRGR